jgi:hypothetical protein
VQTRTLRRDGAHRQGEACVCAASSELPKAYHERPERLEPQLPRATTAGAGNDARAAIRRACAEVRSRSAAASQVEILATGEWTKPDGVISSWRPAKQYERDATPRRGYQAVVSRSDAPSALASLRRAQRIWLELDAPYEVARTRELIAQACSALGDDEAGRLELEAAQELFERLGAAPDLARATMRAGRGRKYGLSERELEVLRLVASGKSNREIASTLVISEHTVARHTRARLAPPRGQK